MQKKLGILAVACALAGVPVGAAVVQGTALYETLFKAGALDGVPDGARLVYQRQVENAVLPDAAERDTGTVILSLTPEQTLMANLEFWQDDRHRNLGSFPASIGNPMIMYFAETVARDMAETAGGSPFYIRNRLKEALVSAADIEEGTADFEGATIPVQSVTLTPFATDPNRERMQGFADLTMTITMSGQVPGYYLSMVADTGTGSPSGYRSITQYQSTEAAE